MFEYLFFDDELRDRFIGFVRGRGAECRLGAEDGLVQVTEEIDERLVEEIEELYDKLLQENAERMEASGEGIEKSTAAVMVQLGDGRPCNIKFDPELLSRMLGCISAAELRDLVQAIALAVENPTDKPVCLL